MSLVTVFDTADAAPEEARSHLVPLGDKFLLYDVDKDPRVVPLKNAYERVKESDRVARATLAQKESALGEAMQKLEALEKAGGKGSDEYQAQLAQVQEKFGLKIKDLETKLEGKGQKIDTLVRRNAAVEAITAAKGNVKLLLPHVLERTRTVEDGDNVTAQVVDEKGNPRIADTLGTPMTLAGLVEEMKKSDEFAPAFEGTGVAGAGTEGGGNVAGAGSVTKRSDLKTDAEKAAFITKHGLEAFQALG